MIINLTAKERCAGQSVCVRVYLCDTMLQKACHKDYFTVFLRTPSSKKTLALY